MIIGLDIVVTAYVITITGGLLLQAAGIQ